MPTEKRKLSEILGEFAELFWRDPAQFVMDKIIIPFILIVIVVTIWFLAWGFFRVVTDTPEAQFRRYNEYYDQCLLNEAISIESCEAGALDYAGMD